MRVLLNEHNLCPRTWTSRQDFLNSDYSDPVIVRPEHHSQGNDLYLCRDANQLEEALNRVGERYYINAYIPKVAEYRVFVAQGRVLSVARKTPADPAAIAWNVSQGGRFDVVRFDDWPLRAVKCAIDSHALSGLDFSAVDVMVGPDGSATCLELNTAPALESDYRVRCISKWFDYCIDHIATVHDAIPLTEARGGYRKFVHPAISDRAIV
jgi:glutathione synthase/RimK-type ligase-like ATP-grasp enzyme